MNECLQLHVPCNEFMTTEDKQKKVHKKVWLPFKNKLEFHFQNKAMSKFCILILKLSNTSN